MKKLIAGLLCLLLVLSAATAASSSPRIIRPNDLQSFVVGSEIEVRWESEFPVFLQTTYETYQNRLFSALNSTPKQFPSGAGSLKFSIINTEIEAGTDSGLSVPEKMVLFDVVIWNDYGADFVQLFIVNPPPAINSVMPEEGVNIREVTLQGNGFDRFKNTVKISGPENFRLVMTRPSNATLFKDDYVFDDNGTEIKLTLPLGLLPGEYTISVIDEDWVNQFFVSIRVPESFRRSNEAKFTILSVEEIQARNLDRATERAIITSLYVTADSKGRRMLVLEGTGFSERENIIVLHDDSPLNQWESHSRSIGGTSLGMVIPEEATGQLRVWVINDSGRGASDALLFDSEIKDEAVLIPVQDYISAESAMPPSVTRGSFLEVRVSGLTANPNIRFCGETERADAPSNFDGTSLIRMIVPEVGPGRYEVQIESPSQGLIGVLGYVTVLP